MAVHALKARYVFPVSAKPIADCLVGIEGERIVAVGKHISTDTVEDLGNVAILPGLINAHTHLEFSDLEKPIGEPGINFVDWLRQVIGHRRQKNNNDVDALKKGLQECTRNGVTTIGEIARPNWPPTVIENQTVDGTVFFELIAPTDDRVAAALELAKEHLSGFKGSGFRVQDLEPGWNINSESQTPNPLVGCVQRTDELSSGWQIGLSPHAPYSVHTDLLQKLIVLSIHKQIPLAMHMAESREEIQLLAEKEGSLKKLLNDLGAYNPTAIVQGLRPLDYLQILAVASRVLVVHGNYLSRDEIGLLADHAESMAVVFCPRSHDYFGHDRYPLEQMLMTGVTVCLGTDSRASSPDLDMLAEIRHVARLYPDLSPQIVLQLGTLQGAKALGRDGEIGSLQTGKYANLAIVPLPKRKWADPYKLLFNSDMPVSATWFRGKKTYG